MILETINNLEGYQNLLLRFTFNLAVTLVLVRWLYYGITKRKDYLFSYIVIGTVVFLLCFLLESVKLQLGFALGLFAIFGIIRYRTMQIPIKEMTYLFLVIGVSVINALTSSDIDFLQILIANLLFIIITYGLEKVWLLRHETSKIIIYENIDLIKSENREKLIEDLEHRTGIKKINKVEIGKINFLRDTANLRVYYFAKDDVVNAADDASLMDMADDDDD
jgi:hypothetical protein